MLAARACMHQYVGDTKRQDCFIHEHGARAAAAWTGRACILHRPQPRSLIKAPRTTLWKSKHRPEAVEEALSSPSRPGAAAAAAAAAAAGADRDSTSCTASWFLDSIHRATRPSAATEMKLRALEASASDHFKPHTGPLCCPAPCKPKAVVRLCIALHSSKLGICVGAAVP